MFDDRRDDKSYTPVQVLCATDSFMSGWKHGPQRSYVAYDLTGLSQDQINKLEDWMHSRSDYKRVRFQRMIPRTTSRNHVSLMNPPFHVIGDK